MSNATSNTMTTRPQESTGIGETTATYSPRFDVWENDDEVVLYGDLPGVSGDDLEIRFEDGHLFVHGKVSRRHEKVEFVHGEYGLGDFQRTFAVGEMIDIERISAEMKDGVLTLHLPKSEKVKPRKIEVKAG